MLSFPRVQMEKTEKTMAELEIDQNSKFEFDSITEAGSRLKPLSGPGCAAYVRYIYSIVMLVCAMQPQQTCVRAVMCQTISKGGQGACTRLPCAAAAY